MEALKAASLEHSATQAKGGCRNGSGRSAKAIASAFNAHLNANVKRLTGAAIAAHVSKGWAGKEPPPKGPAPKIPSAVVAALSTHASMQQLAGSEQKGHMLKRTLGAMVLGTHMEQDLASARQRQKILRRLRVASSVPTEDGVNLTLSLKRTELVDNRRWLWNTYDNNVRWLDGFKHFLLSEGFGEDTPSTLPNGMASEITISEQMLLRLSVGDESHLLLSNGGDRGGSREQTYVNIFLPRSGKRKCTNQKHTTFYALTNAAGEVGPITLMFDLGAIEAEDRKVNAAWVAGLPTVVCRCGHDEPTPVQPVIIVTPKGGTSDDALEKILELAIYPLYPNLAPNWVFDDDGMVLKGPACHRLDGGPGRLDDIGLPMRMRAAERGLFLFPSCVQHGTSTGQEPDQLFAAFKAKVNAVADEIVAERIALRAAEAKAQLDSGHRTVDPRLLTKVDLSNCDIPRCFNGRPEDPLEKRPFEFGFTPEKVMSANYKVGAAPFTKACLKNPKVRVETSNDVVTALTTAHTKHLGAIAELGLNSSVLEVTLPPKIVTTSGFVAPPSEEDDIVRKLYSRPASHIQVCGSIVELSRSTARQCCGQASRRSPMPRRRSRPRTKEFSTPSSSCVLRRRTSTRACATRARWCTTISPVRKLSCLCASCSRRAAKME